jgi:bifunctional non-homologous end joining protein LigD
MSAIWASIRVFCAMKPSIGVVTTSLLSLIVEAKACFIEPMLLLRTERVPEGANCQYECKLDGYRAIAVKSGCRVQLRSRKSKDFNAKYPATVKALLSMPAERVIDGEIVALDQSRRPSFQHLAELRSSKAPLVF